MSQTADDKSSTMLYVILAYGGVLVTGLALALYYVFIVRRRKQSSSSSSKEENDKKRAAAAADIDETVSTNTVGLQDIAFIASKLRPDSTHMDVLLAVTSSPESIIFGTKAYLKREKIVQDRLEEEKKEMDERNKKESKLKTVAGGGKANMFDLDDDGWADDDDDEDLDEEAKRKAQLAKETEEQKKKDREQLKQATGKVKVLLEGLDDGVIGQEWVEQTLSKSGAWPPPDLSFLKDMTFEYEGKKLSALDHPGLRRNLCNLQGRINSLTLNAHPTLLQAAADQKIDQTYFKGSAEFRQRCALLLEATLRTAIGLRSYPLAKTIVEAVAVFKIGCKSPSQTEWFDGIMQKQYGTLPRLEIGNPTIETANESEMATGDVLLVTIDLTRLHAEAFTRQKVAMFQKQGIPPQVALQSYREGWWYFVRAVRLDGTTDASTLKINTDGLLGHVAAEDVARFDTASFEDRLLTAWPMIVQNVAQKSGKVKIQFPAPSVPGRYRFVVSVKSQDFLGADQEFSVEADIKDASTVVRKPKEDKADAATDDNDDSAAEDAEKKDK